MYCAALLLLLVAGGCGAFTPSVEWAEAHSRHWDEMLGEGYPAPLAADFRDDVRLCMNGRCVEGREAALEAFRPVYETRFSDLQRSLTDVVREDGLFSYRFTCYMERGECKEIVTGQYVAYLDEQGKVKEAHTMPMGLGEALAKIKKCPVRGTRGMANTFSRQWEETLLKGTDAITTFLSDDVRFCWRATCAKGKQDVMKMFKPLVDLHPQEAGVTASEMVLEEGMMAFRWDSYIRRGKCEGMVKGYLVAYLNQEGRIKEVHDYPDTPEEFDKVMTALMKCPYAH